MTFRDLIDDRRGSAALAPIFIIVSVLILAALAATLLTGGTVASRSSSQLAQATAERGAIAAVAAELNTNSPAELSAAVAAAADGKYTPAAWIPSPGVTAGVLAAAATSADTTTVTISVDTAQGPARTILVEYRLIPMRWEGGRWVTTTAGAPDRSVWTAVRTLEEAP